MKRKVTYTKKLHAYRVSLMMKRKKPCSLCPASPEFEICGHGWRWGGEFQSPAPCKICKSFIGLKYDNHCPCVELGQFEALKRTKDALKEYYK